MVKNDEKRKEITMKATDRLIQTMVSVTHDHYDYVKGKPRGWLSKFLREKLKEIIAKEIPKEASK